MQNILLHYNSNFLPMPSTQLLHLLSTNRHITNENCKHCPRQTKCMEVQNYHQKTCSHHHRHCHHFDQRVIHRVHHKKVGKSHGPPSRGVVLTSYSTASVIWMCQVGKMIIVIITIVQIFIILYIIFIIRINSGRTPSYIRMSTF